MRGRFYRSPLAHLVSTRCSPLVSELVISRWLYSPKRRSLSTKCWLPPSAGVADNCRSF